VGGDMVSGEACLFTRIAKEARLREHARLHLLGITSRVSVAGSSLPHHFSPVLDTPNLGEPTIDVESLSTGKI